MNVSFLVVFLEIFFSISLTVYASQHRAGTYCHFLLFLSISNLLYLTGDLWRIVTSATALSQSAILIQFCGLLFLLLASYFFIHDACKDKQLKRTCLFWLSVAVLSLFAMLNSISATEDQIYPVFYHFYAIYSYCMFGCIVYIIIEYLRSDKTKNRSHQRTVILLACLLLLACSMFYVVFAGYDPIPLANAISMFGLLYVIKAQKLPYNLLFKWDQMIEAMNDAIIICDEKFHFINANEAAKRLMPALQTGLPSDFINLAGHFQSTGTVSFQVEQETRFYKSTQTYFQNDTTSKGICILLHDITEQERLLQELRIQASVDSLMDIYNRGTFFDLAKLKLQDGNAEKSSVAMLMIDIDGFKQVNDTYGHLAGDAVLRVAAHIVKNTFSENTDLIGRYGGEEIVILAENSTEARVYQQAEQLRQAIAQTAVSYQDHNIRITVSIGVAYSPAGKVHSLEWLLNQADKAMYTAKNKGRNLTMM